MDQTQIFGALFLGFVALMQLARLGLYIEGRLIARRNRHAYEARRK